MAPNESLARLEREVALMDSRLKLVEEGVSNFRGFQTIMRDFVTEHRVEEANKKEVDSRRATIHFALLTGLITLVVGCAIALFTWILGGHHVVAADAMHSQTSYDAAVPKVR